MIQIQNTEFLKPQEINIEVPTGIFLSNGEYVLRSYYNSQIDVHVNPTGEN